MLIYAAHREQESGRKATTGSSASAETSDELEEALGMKYQAISNKKTYLQLNSGENRSFFLFFMLCIRSLHFRELKKYFYLLRYLFTLKSSYVQNILSRDEQEVARNF